MRFVPPRGYCGCGLSHAVPVGSSLHRPHCERYRIPGCRPPRLAPEHAACRWRTLDETRAVQLARWRRSGGEGPPIVWVIPPVGADWQWARFAGWLRDHGTDVDDLAHGAHVVVDYPRNLIEYESVEGTLHGAQLRGAPDPAWVELPVEMAEVQVYG